MNRLEKKLEKASIFRKIRLAYALKFRLNAGNSIVYKVRNGKGWVTEFDWLGNWGDTKLTLSRVLSSIQLDIRKNVKDKIIYILQRLIT